MDISDYFDILKDNGFTDSYFSIKKTLKYYYSDPEVCCSLFRKALESIVNDVYSLFGRSATGSNKRDIDSLKHVIPDKFYDNSIILEMHNIRIIGNAYAHRNDSCGCDPIKDRHTCYIAIKKIAKWLVKCKKLYPEYLREEEKKRKEEEKKRKENKERRNRTFKKIGKIALAFLGIGAAIYGGSKMTKK